MTPKYSSFLSLLIGVCALVPTALRAQDAPSLLKSAYSRIEDQVNDKTFLVVRLDLTALDSATLTKTLDDVYTRFMKERGFSAAKIKSGRREFNAATDALNESVKAFEAFRAALDIREIFLIVQNQSDKSSRVVIPGSQKNLEARAAAFLETSVFKPVKVARGCALTTDVEADAEIYKSFKPSLNAPLKRFYETEASGAIQIFCSHVELLKLYEKAREFLVKAGVASDGPDDEFKTGFESFDLYFQQFCASIDVNRLSANGAIVFTTPERAGEARKNFETLGDKIIDAVYNDGGSLYGLPAPVVEKYRLAPVVREIERASLKAALPKLSGSSLNFAFTPDSDNFWSNTFALALMISP